MGSDLNKEVGMDSSGPRSRYVMIGGFLPHDVAAVDAFAFAQRSGRLAIAAAVEEVFGLSSRFIVSLRCGVPPAGRREGGIGRVLDLTHGWV